MELIDSGEPTPTTDNSEAEFDAVREYHQEPCRESLFKLRNNFEEEYDQQPFIDHASNLEREDVLRLLGEQEEIKSRFESQLDAELLKQNKHYNQCIFRISFLCARLLELGHDSDQSQ